MSLLKKISFILIFLSLSINVLKADDKISYIDIDYIYVYMCVSIFGFYEKYTNIRVKYTHKNGILNLYLLEPLSTPTGKISYPYKTHAHIK